MTTTGSSNTLPHLPSALMKVWPGGDGFEPGASLDALRTRPGVSLLDDDLVAFFPVGGRADVFGAALAAAVRWLGVHLAPPGSDPQGTPQGQVLIFPGQTIHRPEGVTLVPEALLEDIGRQRPELPGPGIYLTGYARGWLRGRHRCLKIEDYLSPSGPRIPLFQWTGDEPEPCRWHNPDVLGRHLSVPRPALQAQLAALLEEPVALVEGLLGCGKSRAVDEAVGLREEPVVWLSLDRAVPWDGTLEGRLYHVLGRDWPDVRPDSKTYPSLVASLQRLAESSGQLPRLVFDGVEQLDRGELASLAAWCGHGGLQGTARLLLVGRHGLPWSEPLAELPTVRVPAMTPDEAASHLQMACDGLGIGDEMVHRWQDVVGGYPLALEEGIIGLYHHGRIRRVYGSFFFDGASDTSYHLSDRFIRLVEAEVRRLGDPLGLRILAASKQSIPARQLSRAMASAEPQSANPSVDDYWLQPFVEGDWVQSADSAMGPALTVASPAFTQALLAPLHGEAVTSLRHALGRIMVASEDGSPGNEWRAYRLLAGSPEALPALLDFSRDSGEAASRYELFDALLSEYRLFQERGGSAKMELSLLWSMLPLARRVDRLHELQNELERAIQLAAEVPRRLVALLTLKAELDQEKGRFRAAEEGLKRALEISEEVDEKHRLRLFLRLGDLLMREDRTHEAREMFTNLLALVQGQSGDLVATCHYYLGNVALGEKRFDEALEHHQAALEIRREKEDRRLGASLSALGALHLERGDYPQAQRFFEQAEDVLSRFGGRPEELSFALRGAGRALTRLGDHTAASRPLKQALELSTGRDVMTEAFARLDIAENHLHLGNVSQALAEARQAHFRLSLITNAPLLGDVELLLGQILMRQHQEDAAREHFQEALRTHRRLADPQRQALDHSWLLELSLREGDREGLLRQSQALEAGLARLAVTPDDEILGFRLFKAFDWLERRQIAVPAALPFLERAYRELMRKTAYLEPEQRHHFLFQNREHEELLAAAAKYQLAPP